MINFQSRTLLAQIIYRFRNRVYLLESAALLYDLENNNIIYTSSDRIQYVINFYFIIYEYLIFFFQSGMDNGKQFLILMKSICDGFIILHNVSPITLTED